MAFRSRRTHLLLALLYGLLVLGTLAYAKKDDFPTAAPTKEKKDKNDKNDDNQGPQDDDNTQQDPPQDDPPQDYVTQDPATKAPTEYPTKAPTEHPTVSPTETPTEYPTFAPTPEPSTPEPTAQAKETTLTVTSPPTEGNLVEVRMASMIMDIETDGREVDGGSLEKDMEDLLNYDVLDRIYDKFSHVDLEIMLLSTNTTRRQLQVAGYEANIEGSAFFVPSNDIPTPEQLSEFLFTYFSIYDSGDLTDGLTKGSPAITTSELRTIGGVDVDIQSLNKGNAEGSSESSSVSVGVIIGLVAGILALVAAIGALIWMRRKNKEGEKGSIASPGARTEGMSPSPQISLEDDISVGVSSIDDSIYTHNSNLIIKNPKPRNPSVPPEQYDANRLDKVISNAHDFAKDDSLHSGNFYDYERKESFEDIYSENSEDAPAPIDNPVSF